MQGIDIFLTRFRSILPADYLVKKITQAVLQKELGIKLEPEMIKVGKRTLHLSVSPAVKNLIFLKREQLASEIAKLLGEPKERAVL